MDATTGLRLLLVLLLWLITFLLQLNKDCLAKRWEQLPEEEELELNRRLKLINKPAMRSFQTVYGDIIDCVDIYKQLAFDHPLLKNHTIQMKPTSIPKGTKEEASRRTTFMEVLPENINCPEGSVPIKRVTKEDLLIANHHVNSMDPRGRQYALLQYYNPERKFGAKGGINVWQPKVKADQYSTGSIWIVNGPRETLNYIETGWGVNNAQFSNITRFYTLWTVDYFQKTGCYNTQCPGFVQISKKIFPGLPIKPISVYGGDQYLISLTIHQDRVSLAWWLMYGDESVGYWPGEIFTDMAEGATTINWGGSIYSPVNEGSPPMGSGHDGEGFNKTAYINSIQILDSNFRLVDPDPKKLEIILDKFECYDAYNNLGHSWGQYVYYGGPGNCTYKSTHYLS